MRGLFRIHIHGRENLPVGFAHFAIRDQVPVVPVALTGTRSLWLFKRIDVVLRASPRSLVGVG